MKKLLRFLLICTLTIGLSACAVSYTHLLQGGVDAVQHLPDLLWRCHPLGLQRDRAAQLAALSPGKEPGQLVQQRSPQRRWNPAVDRHCVNHGLKL